jgi:hypothetical protein
MAQGGLSVQSLINQAALQKQQEAANQQTQAANAIALQQAQQNQQDTQSFNRAFKDANGDWDQTIQNATQNGVSGTFITQRQIARADQVAKLATADKDVLANAQTRSDALAKDAVALKQIQDPAERAKTYNTMVNGHLTSGGGYKPSDFPANPPSDDELDTTIAHNAAAQSMIKEALANQQEAAKLPGAKAEATAKELSTAAQFFQGVPPNNLAWASRRAAAAKTLSPETMALIPEEYSPQGAESVRQLGIAPKDLADMAPTKLELQSFLQHPPPGYKPTPLEFMRYEKSITPAIQQYYAQGGGMGVPGTPGGGGGPTPPALAGGPNAPAQATPAAGATPAPQGFTINNVPPQIRSQVQEVLDYRGKIPPANSRNAQSNAIRQWVTQLKPDYDETVFPERNKIVQQYAKDASSGDLGSINTALGHLNELNEAAKALSSNDVPFLHSLAARYNLATGGDAASTYQMILHRVGPEMTSAYVKGGGGEGERGANQGDFDIGKGAKQIQSNIAESAQLLNSKLDSKRTDWNNTFHPTSDADNFDNRFITPSARNVLNTLSSQAPTNRVKAPAQGMTRIRASDGSLHDVPTGNLAAARKIDSGLQVVQ